MVTPSPYSTGGGGGAPQARVGWGLPEMCMGIPLQRCGWGGAAEGVCGYPASEGAGGVGAAGRSAWVSLRRRGRGGGAVRSKMVGVWETGEGEQVPPPRQPLPPWRYPHGPVPGDRWERAGYGFPPAPPQIRFPAGSTPDTISHRLHPGYGCSPDIATHGPRPQEGAGGGCRRGIRVSLMKARAGWGCRQKRVGILLRRRGRGGYLL